eukprot:TRINITY_DN20496_c0_g2_i1.p1 TRINITY_DN20496_c0_g2~~TRINITY_DN20496_c0_g2_i1.p1  ORF type:complete len:1585 (-),score=219.77 TRINITY_DN20496_c0_g2_i1:50-4405(-)
MVASFLVRIWPFLIWEGITVILCVSAWTFFWVLRRKSVSPFQALCARIQVLTMLLMLCPLLRSVAVTNRMGIQWALLLRSIVEMEVFGLVCIAIPELLLGHTLRCARLPPASARLPPAEKLSDGAQAQLNDIALQSSRLLDRVHGGRWLIYTCMMLRVGVYAARATVYTFVFSYDQESLLVKAFLNGTCLALLAVAAPYAFSRQALPASDGGPAHASDFRGLLAHAWGCRPQLPHLQMTCFLLILASQLQDVILLGVFGSERVAQLYAACLYVHEVAICALFVSFYVSNDQITDMYARITDKPLPGVTRLKLLSKPPMISCLFSSDKSEEFLTDEEARLCAATMYRGLAMAEHRAVPKPCWRPTEKEAAGLNAEPPTYAVKTIWRGVLFDAFTPFVRSRAMPVVMLTLMLNHIYYVYPRIAAVCNHVSDNTSVNSFALTMALILVAFVMWFVGGLMLVGNNVFVRRGWLWLAACAFGVSGALELREFSLMPENSGDLWIMAHVWQHFLVACIGLYGFFLAVRAYFEEEGRGDYHRGEREAFEYTADLLGPAPRAAQRMVHAAYDFPPLLLAGGLATVPVILSLTFFTVFVGRTIMHYGRLAQVFALAAQGKVDSTEVFETFDVNLDGQLAPSEMGVSTLLYFLGLPELTNAALHLWNQVDVDGDNRLSIEEARKFLMRIFAVKAAVASWVQADASLAAQQLVVALDADENGALSSSELSTGDLAIMLRTFSPELSEGLRPEIQTLWNEADANGDRELDANELPALITALKSRVAQLQLAVRNTCQELVREAAATFSHTTEVVAEASSATARAAGKATDRAMRAWKENRDTLQRLAKQPPNFALALEIADRVWRLLTRAALGSFAAAKSVLVASLKIFSPELAAKANASIQKPPVNVSRANASQANASEEHPVFLAVSLPIPEALPALMEEAMPTIRDGVARGLLLLDLLEKDPKDGAPIVLEALDTDGDGKLDGDELGLEYMLALISPALATWANDLVKSSSTGKLSESEIALVLSGVQALVRDYVGDLDGDGAVTRRDLARALRAAVTDAFSSGGEPSVESSEVPSLEPEVSPAVAPAPAPMQALLQLRNGQSEWSAHAAFSSDLAVRKGFLTVRRGTQRSYHASYLPLPSTTSDWMTSPLADALRAFVTWVSELNIRRVETCFFSSVLLTMLFGFYIVYNTFEASVRIFSASQKGDHSFRAYDVMRDSLSRPDYSTFYPGMLFSTVLMGMVTLFPILFIVLLLATSISFWLSVWRAASPMIIWVGGTLFVTHVLLRWVLLDWCCMKDGHVVNPRLFSCLTIVLSLVNFPLSALYAITRFFTILPYAFLKFHQLDRSLLQHSVWSMDFGLVSFLTTVGLGYEALNPVRRAFVSELNPGVHRLYGKLNPDGPAETRAYPEPRSYNAKGYLKSARNKWWLLKTLSENPSLSKLRRRDVSASAGAAKPASEQP